LRKHEPASRLSYLGTGRITVRDHVLTSLVHVLDFRSWSFNTCDAVLEGKLGLDRVAIAQHAESTISQVGTAGLGDFPVFLRLDGEHQVTLVVVSLLELSLGVPRLVSQASVNVCEARVGSLDGVEWTPPAPVVTPLLVTESRSNAVLGYASIDFLFVPL
jgi:hypothetical protein